VVGLEELRRALESERPPHAEAFPDVPFVTLNVGRIAGGVAANVIPDRCEIELGARLLPGMETGAFIGRVEEAIRRAAGDTPHRIEVVGESPPAALDDRSDLWQWLMTGPHGGGESRSVPFATDAGWLQRLGFECVIWGPGAIEVAHRANEFVPIDELDRARATLGRAVRRWCEARA
jgi:acetylornithine deacetylase